MSMTILVIEDEKDLSELLEYNLKKEGFAVATARSGAEGLKMAIETSPDMVVLDLMLPDIFGIDVCRTLRENSDTASIPIIMLTAKSQTSDKIEGLTAGADDYLTKPFSPRELVARIKAISRRSVGTRKRTSQGKIAFDYLSIDLEACQVMVDGRPVELTATEYKLLTCLVESKGRVLSRDQLLDAVWREDAFVEQRTVDVHIRHLRTRIERDPAHPRFIKTVRGLGYRFETGGGEAEGD